MPVTRLLLIVLLLLNLLALAAGLGFLGTSTPRGEPERLTNQIDPERIVLRPDVPAEYVPTQPEQPPPARARTLPPEPVPAAPVEAPVAAPEAPTAPPERVEVRPYDPPACVAYAELGNFRADEVESLARSSEPTATLTRKLTGEPSNWWVLIPPAASLQEAERSVRALRAQGVSDLFILRDDGPNRFAISLGLFRTEARARQHLSDLQSRGVRGAEIAPRDGASYRIEIGAPASRLSALTERLNLAFPGLAGEECVP